jgi:hypothetical protein
LDVFSDNAQTRRGKTFAAQLGTLAAQNPGRPVQTDPRLATLLSRLRARRRAKEEAEDKLRANNLILGD